MKAVDVYDITQSFESLDEYCEGALSMDRILTLFLGLGYQPIDMTKGRLEQCFKNSSSSRREHDTASNELVLWTLDDVLRVFAKFQRFGSTGDTATTTTVKSRTQEWHNIFASIVAKSSQKNTISSSATNDSTVLTAADLVRWSGEMKKKEDTVEQQGEAAISESLALSIIRHIAKDSNATCITPCQFVQFYSPPEP